MNLFSRLFFALVCLIVAAAAVGIVVLAWTIPQDSIDGLRDAVNWMDRNNEDTQKAVLTAGAVLVVLVTLSMALIVSLPPSASEVKVADLKVGDAVLSTAAISQRVEEAVHQVPHVAAVRAAVKAKRKGVLVALELYVDPDANLAAVTDQACEAAQDVLTNRVHVALHEPPHARLHYRELRLKNRPPTTRVTVTPNVPPDSSSPAAPTAHSGQARDAGAEARQFSDVREPSVAVVEPKSAEESPEGRY